MKKKPARAKQPAAVIIPGGPMRRPPPAQKGRHPAARQPGPGTIIPGGPMKRPAAKKKPVKRKLALGEAVACCSAEALAASLRLTGWPVSDEDVLALYELTADGPDAGATLSETLEVAQRFGLAGRQPRWYAESRAIHTDSLSAVMARPALILGMDLPGPHAVLADGRAWWSWGEPYDPAAFPDAVIEEAWTIRW